MAVNSDKKGMSLIEVMLGMMLIAIIAILALGFSVYCNRFAMHTDLRLRAASFARETMESLYWTSPLNLPIVTNPTDDLAAGTFKGNKFQTGYGATRRYTVTNTSDPNYEVISATVTWNN